MEDTVISEVKFTNAAGVKTCMRLSYPLPRPASPATLCMLAIPRMPVSSSARVMLGLVAAETIAGITPKHTYAEFGQIIGRGTHTAIRAAAELREAGILLTARAGFRSSLMTFSCAPLICWAELVTGSSIAPDASERVSEPSEPHGDEITGPEPAMPPEARNEPSGTVEGFFDDIVDDRPDWPTVPGNWRDLNGIPLPCDDVASMSVPLHVKPWLGPLPRLPDGGFDMDKLTRMPYQMVVDYDDDEATHAFCQAKGDAPDGPIEVAHDDYMVDASEERNAEMARAEKRNDSDDGFDFDSGSESFDSDIGSGVVMNPDL